MDGPPPSTTRRRLLATAGATAAGALGGCTDRLWGTERASPGPVSLTVTTPPTDDDPFAIQIASHVTENLRAAGVDAVHEPVAETDLYRDVLVDREFEVVVARHPGFEEFDALRPLLHSRFVTERGWQNPFSFSNGTADDLLERQARERGYQRRATFGELFEHLLETAPYTAVAHPETVCGARERLDLLEPPRRPLDYLSVLERAVDVDRPLRVATFERSLPDRLDPLAVGAGDGPPVLGLVYDPLVRTTEGGAVPWLADRIDWTDDGTTATVTVREGATWHDGTPLDADDVAFTFAFVDDTSLGAADSPVPAPRYRGRTSLVESATATDERRVRFSFGDRPREVARRALTVPILPEHVWRPRAEPVDGALLTEALLRDDPDLVGAGLFSLADADDEGIVVLEPFEDHPLRTAEPEGLPDVLGRSLSAVEFHVSPNPGEAIDRLVAGEIDLISDSLPHDEAEPLEAESGGDVVAGPTRSFYFVGYNLRHPELGNPRFRRIVSRLVDRRFVVEEFFGGRGRPARSHSALAGVAPADWEFPQTDGVAGFPGADGEVDEDAVRSLFVDAGYRYENGDLVA